MIATATLSLVFFLMIVLVIFTICAVVAILYIWRKNGAEEKTQSLEQQAEKSAIENRLDDDDGLYESVNNFHRDLEYS
jgi:flagellar basal body-associated protein FliL